MQEEEVVNLRIQHNQKLTTGKLIRLYLLMNVTLMCRMIMARVSYITISSPVASRKLASKQFGPQGTGVDPTDVLYTDVLKWCSTLAAVTKVAKPDICRIHR